MSGEIDKFIALSGYQLARQDTFNGGMICSQVFTFVNGQHQYNHHIIFNRVNKTKSLFFQFDFIAIVKIAMQT